MKFLSALLFATALNGVAAQNDPTITIFANLQNIPGLSTLVMALETSGLDALLDDPTVTLTVFPANNGWWEFGDPYLTAAYTDLLLTPEFSSHLKDLLLFHVTDGGVTSADLIALDGDQLSMENTEVLTVGSDSNLIPALTNSEDVVVRLFPAVIDSFASNGVYQQIEGILLPSFYYQTFATLGPKYSTLLSLLVQVDLADTVLGAEKLTVFAPSNAAFLALGVDTPTEDCVVTEILLYHALDTVVTTDKLGATQDVTTLNGATLTITKDITQSAGQIMVGPATVETADILVRNGVAHAINQVLIPPTTGCSSTMAPSMMPSMSSPSLFASTLVQAAGTLAAAAMVL
jgi:transforming growth factor-beta-induced protein